MTDRNRGLWLVTTLCPAALFAGFLATVAVLAPAQAGSAVAQATTTTVAPNQSGLFGPSSPTAPASPAGPAPAPVPGAAAPVPGAATAPATVPASAPTSAGSPAGVAPAPVPGAGSAAPTVLSQSPASAPAPKAPGEHSPGSATSSGPAPASPVPASPVPASPAPGALSAPGAVPARTGANDVQLLALALAAMTLGAEACLFARPRGLHAAGRGDRGGFYCRSWRAVGWRPRR